MDNGIAKAKSFQMANADAMSALVDAVPGASGALSSLSSIAPIAANPYVLAGAAIVGVGIAAKSAYDDFAIFNKEMAKLNVTAQLSKDELSLLEDKLISIGAKSTVPLDDVPKALTKIVSAGMELPDAMNALEPTLLAAKAGFTDIETVAGAAVSVMNSAGITDATKTYDILFATLNKGNAEFSDIAQYLPKIVPGALQSGFALEETAGAFAFLTAQGQTAERSTTLLENAFKSLSDPKRIADFNKLGVSIFDSAGNMRPLTQISEQLGTKLDGLTDAERINKLNSLGLDMEAAAAFAALSGDTDKLKSIIDFTANSSGELNAAVKNSANSTDSWLQIQNRLGAAWLQFGKFVSPVFDAIGAGVLQVIDWFGQVTAEGTLLRDSIDLLGFAFSFVGDILGQLGKAAGFVFGHISSKFNTMYSFIRPLITRLADGLGGLGKMIAGVFFF
ncbi:MAG: phage tail tape measure protein [Saprospiraceae bacterium]|nr:phage tail tape measure protein [Saprospiraceae bacterium]